MVRSAGTTASIDDVETAMQDIEAMQLEDETDSVLQAACVDKEPAARNTVRESVDDDRVLDAFAALLYSQQPNAGENLVVYLNHETTQSAAVKELRVAFDEYYKREPK